MMSEENNQDSKIPSGSVSGSESSISEQNKQDSKTPSRSISISDWMNALPVVLGVVVVGISWLVGWVNENVPNIGWRRLIYLGIALIPLIVLVWYLRRLPPFAQATNLVGVFLVAAVPLVLAILYAEGERVLLLKAGTALFLSVLPGWLYLQFLIVRGQTLRDEYVLNLYRLHIDDYGHLPTPPRGSLFYERWQSSRRRTESDSGDTNDSADTDPNDNVYLRKFEGAYGKPTTRGSRESLWPIVFTTLLLCTGWVAVLNLEVILGQHLTLTELALSGKPAVPGEPLAFGFIGSYFFIVQMLARRYFQDDLKTSAYINAMTRVIIVSLLVVAIDASGLLTAGPEKVFAFVIGVFPQVGLQAIRNSLSVPLRLLVPSMKKAYPLSDLDGLNVWYEARLLEEGIEDLQNLATVNLVDAILRTRVPVERLVDWVDQAHLYLRIPKEKREEIRKLGIRTATDLIRALDSSKKGPESEFAGNAVAKVLVGDQADSVENKQVLLNILRDEPNLYHIRQWKRFTAELDEQ